MLEVQAQPQGGMFSKKDISQELQKILHFAAFRDSLIMRRFLSFIVEETVEGRSNCLKEYTIALYVLGKPHDFKPQENGIVRIHAGRLRRALFNYYTTEGANDPIYISIPKGKYVPEFSDKKTQLFEQSRLNDGYRNGKANGKTPVVAVLPLECPPNEAELDAFADNLCLHLCTALLNSEHVHVIAHQAVRSMLQKTRDINEICKALGADYIIAGGVQWMNNNVRLNFQLINSMNSEQVWGDLYKKVLNSSSIFDIQDEIVNITVKDLDKFWRNESAMNAAAPVLAAV